MKKLFFILLGSMSLLTAGAEVQLEQGTVVPKKLQMIQKVQTAQTPNSRAEGDETLVFGYCAGINSALGLAGYVMEGDIEIPAEQAEEWIGNKVVGIRVGFGVSSNPNMYVYVTKALDGETEAIMRVEVQEQMAWNTYMFDDPYVIDGDRFFVGFQSSCSEAGGDFPLGVDMDTTNFSEYGDWFGLDNEFDHLGELYGNVCVQMIMEGDKNMPHNNGKLLDMHVPSVIEAGTIFQGGFLVRNDGVDPIEKVSFEMTLAGVPVGTTSYTFKKPISSGDFEWVILEDLSCEVQGDGLLAEVKLLDVNGQPNENPGENELSMTFMCSDVVFRQNVLVEEFTATWCGWCPRGIVGMAYMKENYGTRGFIGVAVHDGDAMVSSSYSQLVGTYAKNGLPGAVANRMVTFDPGTDTLQEYFKLLSTDPSFAGITVEANYTEDDNSINVTGHAQFSLNIENVNYGLAFGIIENNVGPYIQDNFYSKNYPANNGEYLEGWSDLPAAVGMYYNEVARTIIAPFGIEGSLPTNIEKDTDYSYSVTIPASKSWVPLNCEVVGYILDLETGFIINSCILDTIENAAAGVEGIEVDKAENFFRVYNTQGVKVMETENRSDLNNLPNGIYIVNGKKVKL